MRISVGVLGVVLCFAANRAEADVSKAWAAAKAHLPAATQFVIAADVAVLRKGVVLPKLIQVARGLAPDLDGYYMAAGACGWDPITVVDGVVAGALANGDGAVFLQLTIDRKQVSKCLESINITVKQDGPFTVVSFGGDQAVFAWIGTNVAMITFPSPGKKDVDVWFNQKGFATSKLGGLAGKLDPKATIAFASVYVATIPKLSLSGAYGNVVLAGGKLTGSAVAITADANTASLFAREATTGFDRDLRKNDMSPALTKIVSALKFTASGSEVTVKGSVLESDVVTAIVETLKKDKASDVANRDATKDLALMEQLAQKMCVCKDKACADKLNQELTKWGAEIAARPRNAKPKADPSLAKRSYDIMTRYTECMTKAMMAGNKP